MFVISAHPRSTTVPGITLVLLLAMAAPNALQAAEKQVAEQKNDGQEAKQQLVYRPPLRGAPQTRIGGGTRGGGELPAVRVLAPDHTSWTTKARPTLYWYASGSIRVPTEFVLIRPGAVEPVLETRLQSPNRAGIHAIDLTRHPVRLEPGVEYRWFIALVPDPDQRSNDVVASGTVEHRAPDPELRQALADTSPGQRPALYALHGYWYDALATLAELIDQRPQDPGPRRQRMALLDQAGLDVSDAAP